MIDGGKNRSNSRASAGPDYGANFAHWLAAVGIALLIAGALFGWLNAAFSTVLVVLFVEAVCGGFRRTQKLWDEKTQLYDDRAKLERLLADQQSAVENVRDTAHANERAKSAFISSISHELRTPLNAIIGFSEILRDGLLGPQSPRYTEYARDIHA